MKHKSISCLAALFLIISPEPPAPTARAEQNAGTIEIICPATVKPGERFDVSFGVYCDGMSELRMSAVWDGTVVCSAVLTTDNWITLVESGVNSFTALRRFYYVGDYSPMGALKGAVAGNAGSRDRIRVQADVIKRDGSRVTFSAEFTVKSEDPVPKSSDSRLSSLSVSGYGMTPSFSPDRMRYSVTVAPRDTSLSLNWTKSDSRSSVDVLGNSLTEGDVTAVRVRVTAEDGSSSTYYIDATRPARSSDASLSGLSVTGYTMSPAFDPDRLEYTVNVSALDTKLNLNFKTSSPAASTEVHGNTLKENAVTSVSITVTAENGSTRTYVIKAFRPAVSTDSYLSSLSVSGYSLTPAFSRERLEYTLNVSNGTSKLDISYRPSGTGSQTSVTGNSLTEGAVTTVSVKVTAQDGSSRTYTIKAFRAARSSDNYLTSISAGPYPLSPSFSPGRLEYSITVPAAVSQLDLTLKASDTKASISVLGNSLAENAMTPVQIRVSAENGSTRTYVIKVTRAPKSSDNRLTSLSAGPYKLSPSFSATRLTYTLAVPESVRNLDLKCKTSDPNATFTVRGNDLAATGGTVKVEVTAENSSVRTYTLNVTRAAVSAAPSSENRLQSLVPSEGTLTPAFSRDVQDYTLSHTGDAPAVTFKARAMDASAKVLVSGPEVLPGGTTGVFTVTVTAADGKTLVYRVTVTLPEGEGSSFARLPVMAPPVPPSSPETMILSAGRLNTLAGSAGVSIILSNPVGRITVFSEDVTGGVIAYYDLTLVFSSRHDLSGAALPEGSLVVSTVHEGELFGQAEFEVFVSGEEARNVYLYDPGSGSFTVVASRAVPRSGAVSFTASRSGTFVITQDEISGAVPVTGIAGTRRIAFPSRLLPAAAGAVSALFFASYAAGAFAGASPSRRRRRAAMARREYRK